MWKMVKKKVKSNLVELMFDVKLSNAELCYGPFRDYDKLRHVLE